ncbi:sugar ABC transporter substrate-binding protein [Lactonifactor longoviformis]|uniref:sugar ABC transporter substrate-binding protein n=1 Tax=Lactonifactor longoviformis TaxID=341220 RepID=UPI00210D1633|nr:sugar ABC transporter substrate-binding protein [Lactonifactor longoviformis]MCQ4669803.1 sugar ABC transporter substrate-binding protein [Lactonifactor longoviformis]
MKRKQRKGNRWISILLAALLAVSMLPGCAKQKAEETETTETKEEGKTAETKQPEDIRLGMIVGDLSNPFFLTVKEAAEKRAGELGVSITVLGSKTIEENVKAGEDMIQTKVDVMAITPFDATGNIPLVESANEAGIPVFTIDSTVDGGEVVSYIGTDNELGGELAGEWMADKINGKGKIAIIEGGSGSSTNTYRLKGFRNVIDQYPEIEVVASVAANWARDEGLNAMSDIIAGNPDLAAVMAMNDEMALGAMEALKAAGKTQDVVLCGYNGAAEAIQNIYNGDMAATVAQFPEEMGRMFVDAAYDIAARGVYPDTDHLKPPVYMVDTVSANKAMAAITDTDMKLDYTTSVKADKRYRLGMVVGDLSNPFFLSVKNGAEAMADIMGVDITVLGSKTIEENVKASEDMIQTKVDAIAITPFDASGNIPVVEAANEAGIPVFTIDSDVDGGEVVAYIGTDNVLGGELAGEWMTEQIGGKGKIAIIEGGSGSSTNTDRLKGFHSVIDQYPDIEVAASVAANWARDEGLNAMSDIIAGNPDLSAVMAMNDEMAIGAMEALKAANKTEDVLLCGYNGALEAIQNVYKGEMAATIVQYPEEMGKMFVENAVLTIQGTPPENRHIKPPIQTMSTVYLEKIYDSLQEN